jgi:hypothetical protein
MMAKSASLGESSRKSRCAIAIASGVWWWCKKSDCGVTEWSCYDLWLHISVVTTIVVIMQLKLHTRQSTAHQHEVSLPCCLHHNQRPLTYTIRFSIHAKKRDSLNIDTSFILEQPSHAELAVLIVEVHLGNSILDTTARQNYAFPKIVRPARCL